LPQVSTIFFFVWAAALLVAIWSLRIAQVFAKRMPRIVARPLEPVQPAVAVILPLKGVDEDTEQNIAALLKQDYPNYRLIFTIESANDPVLPLLESIAAEIPFSQQRGGVDIVIAGLATTRGQKIHNQMAAVARTTPDDEILAFMDVDAQPGPTWLHALVAPLTYGPHIGCTTGYRFYVPASPHAANSIVSVINAGVAALFGPYRRSFAWGGSMALRRADFFSYGIHDAWQNAVSDDYVMSHVVKHVAKTKIHFVPRCMVASAANFNWASLFEFATRQYRITRICAPAIWLAAITGPALFLSAFLYTLISSVRGIFVPTPDRFTIPLMFIALYAVSIVRGHLLLVAAKRLLPNDFEAIGKAAFYFTFGYPFVQLCNLLALVGSAFGNTIQWRSISYTMLSRTRTIVQRPTLPPMPTPPHEPALTPLGEVAERE